MLSKISWSEYFYAVALILVVYYAYVFLRYYAGDVQHNLSRKKSYTQELEEEEPIVDVIDQDEPTEVQEAEDNNFDQIESLIEQIKIRIEADSKTVIYNENFGLELQQVIQSFPALKYTPYKSAINELILTECSKYGITKLDEEDIAKFWD